MAERRYGASCIVVRFPGQKDMAGRTLEPAVGVARVLVLG
jgi:hypothetical protein